MRTGLRLQRAWLLLLWALAGCGPGVGGTGTGEQSSALNFFGAKPASVCSASFAEKLKCPSRLVIGPTQVELPEGSETIVWVDDAANGRVTARINVSNIDFEALCEGVRFTGTWGKRQGEGAGRFYGYYTTRDLSFAAPGTLSAQAANGASLAYVLQDSTGQVVFGPRVLQETAIEPAPARCYGPQSPGQPAIQPGGSGPAASQDDSIGRVRSKFRPEVSR